MQFAYPLGPEGNDTTRWVIWSSMTLKEIDLAIQHVQPPDRAHDLREIRGRLRAQLETGVTLGQLAEDSG